LRPPGNIGNGQPRWPIQPAPASGPQTYSDTALRQPNYGARSNGPISLTAPGVEPQEEEIDLPAEGSPQMRDPRGGGYYQAAPAYPPRDRYPSSSAAPNSAPYSPAPYSERPEASQDLPRLGPARGDPVNRSVRSR
jgi:hypothetical protein